MTETENAWADERLPGPPMNANGPRRCKVLDEDAGQCMAVDEPGGHRLVPESGGALLLHQTWAVAPDGTEYLHVWQAPWAGETCTSISPESHVRCVLPVGHPFAHESAHNAINGNTGAAWPQRAGQ